MYVGVLNLYSRALWCAESGELSVLKINLCFFWWGWVSLPVSNIEKFFQARNFRWVPLNLMKFKYFEQASKFDSFDVFVVKTLFATTTSSMEVVALSEHMFYLLVLKGC